MAWNLGSIADKVLEIYEVSSSISGNLINISDVARRSVESSTGLTIGSVNIDEKYSPALVAQTALLTFTGDQTKGTDKNVRLGEFSITQASNNNIITQLREDVRREINALGRRAPFKQTFT